jgi:hypothetical protein
MSARKQRVTVMVNRDLLEAANQAVASGRASSLRAWVNAAMAERAAKDRHLRALAEAIASYEAELGTIAEAEMIAQQRKDRRTAIAVREPRKRTVRAPRRRVA